MNSTVSPLRIAIGGTAGVGAIAIAPERPLACLVLAHGAGAGMEHPFMRDVAHGLAERGLATLRFQFPALERGSKRPDRPPLAHAAVRAAVAAAATRFPALPLLAGGKSFGGRMTSQAQSLQPLPGVVGLVFLGFPLHRPGEPSTDRADHLQSIRIPMLFVQGTRDEMAAIGLLRARVAGLTAALTEVEGADHGFHVAARSGRSDAEALAAALDAVLEWARPVVLRHGGAA